MDIRDRKGLRLQARYALEGCGKALPRLSLISSALLVLIPLLANALTLLLDGPISQTGGLSGMGTRNILETAQQLLVLVPSLLLPFWEIGFIFAVLGCFRGHDPRPRSLTEGFSRFGAVLRLYLLMFAGIYVLSMAVVTLTSPLCTGLIRLLMPLMQAQSQEQLDSLMAQLQPGELLLAAWPMVLVMLGALLYFAYRLRFAQYLIMDNAYPRAMSALVGSFRLTRRNLGALLRLDLSFWWYYALSALLAVLGYLDVLLPALGIQLPLSSTVAYFLFFGLYGLGTLALHYFLRPQVALTYAAAYEALGKAQQPS